jgi:hypothetical protein
VGILLPGKGQPHIPERFTLAAAQVILWAGALGTVEILLRSEWHGLSLSPRVGTGFTGNGDFFGLAYNSEYRTNVLGFGHYPASPWRVNAPGPTIVDAIGLPDHGAGRREWHHASEYVLLRCERHARSR